MLHQNVCVCTNIWNALCAFETWWTAHSWMHCCILKVNAKQHSWENSDLSSSW
jgi:hypothetical protein